MPRVNAPDLPTSGPGSALSSFKSLHPVRAKTNITRKKRPLDSSSSSSSSSSSDESSEEDELSFTSNSANGNNFEASGKASSKKSSSSSLLIAPKLVTRPVITDQHKSPSVLKKNSYSNGTDSWMNKKQQHGSTRKVSFSNTIVQDMPCKESSDWKTTPRNQHQKKSALTQKSSSFMKGGIQSTSSLTLSKVEKGTVVTPPPWTTTSTSFSAPADSISKPAASSSSSRSKSSIKGTNNTKTIDLVEKAGNHKSPNQQPFLSDDVCVRQIHCIAVDTRCLQTSLGNIASQSFIHQIQGFLQSCSIRGILPKSISIPHYNAKDNKMGSSGGGVHISTQPLVLSSASIQTDPALRDGNESHESSFYPLLPRLVIRPPSNVGNVDQREDKVHVPKLLLAHESWTMFASFVQSMVEEMKVSVSVDSTIRQPLDISILTNDMALFSDADVENHRRGMDRFREKISSFFEKGVIRGISIVIVDTDTFALWENIDPKASQKNKSIHLNLLMNNAQYENDGDDDALKNDKENLEENVFLSKLFHPHRLKVKECLRSMQDRLSLLRDIESKYNDDNGKSHSIPVRLKVMDCNDVSFQSLLQDWTTDAVKSIGTTGGMARVRFDLPPTSDGTQCSVVLDLTYAVFPHRLDVPNCLWKDMAMLHDSTFHIVQMTPLADVDASLIYGVPFVAKASSEGELVQYNEMKVLVQQLWKYLVTYQVALVLQLDERHRSLDTSCDIPGKTIRGSDFLYHSDRQVFVLIVEENNDIMPLAPNGILYRYANSPDKILYHGSNDACESMDSTQDMYYDYVVESLECVLSCPINPFAQQHETSRNEQKKERQSSEDSGPVASPDQEIGSSPEAQFEFVDNYWDDDDDDEADVKSTVADSPKDHVNLHGNQNLTLSDDSDLFEY